MLVAQVIEGEIIQVAEVRQLCEWFPPTPEQLRDRNLVECNMWLDHDPQTQHLVPCEPYLEGDWVYLVRVEDRPPPPPDDEPADILAAPEQAP